LEASLTRSLIHALRRFGFSESAFADAMRSRLSDASLQLLEKNKNSVLHEPHAAAAAYAFACVLDRVRFGVLPPSLGRDILQQQAAIIASALSTHVDRWNEFRAKIHVDLNQPMTAVYDALALGWTEKWALKD
jgi:hypothetical protein